MIKIIPLGDEAGDEILGGGIKNQSFSLDLPEGLQKKGGAFSNVSYDATIFLSYLMKIKALSISSLETV